MTGTARGQAPRWQPVARLAAALALGAGLLAWLLRHADWAPLLQAVRSLPAAAWVAAAAGLLGTYALRALRLRAEWRHVRRVPLTQCLRLVLAHNAALLLLPLRAGEAGYLWLVRRQWGVSLGDAARSLLWLRLQDAAVLAVLALALLLPLPAWGRTGLALAAVCALTWLLPRLLGLARRRWTRLDTVAQAVLSHRADATGWLCCCGNWLLKLAVIGTLLSALGGLQPPTVHRAAGAALGGELAGALPLQGPAGLGTYEAGVWAGARVAGGAVQPVVAAAIAVHAFSLVVALVGAAVAQVLWPPPAALPTDAAPPQPADPRDPREPFHAP